MKTYTISIDPESISESGLSNMGFRSTIEDIIEQFGFEAKSSSFTEVTKYTSDKEKGTILLIHNSNKMRPVQTSYGLASFGVTKPVVEQIEKDIIKTGYLKLD